LLCHKDPLSQLLIKLGQHSLLAVFNIIKMVVILDYLVKEASGKGNFPMMILLKVVNVALRMKPVISKSLDRINRKHK
jgi:hypothetical protein